MNETKILNHILREGIKELSDKLDKNRGISPEQLAELISATTQGFSSFKGDPGRDGKDGKDGKIGPKPKRGVDYWTPDDINNLVSRALRLIPRPKAGVDYYTAKDRDAFTAQLYQNLVKLMPVKGKDYYTAKEKTEFSNALIKRLEAWNKQAHTSLSDKFIGLINEQFKAFTKALKDEIRSWVFSNPEDIARALETLKRPNRGEDKRLDASAIKNLPIPVTNIVNNTSGGGGGNGTTPITILPATGLVNGFNTSFTFSAIPNVIVRDGVALRETSSDGTSNWTVMSLSPAVIELVIAPNFDIFGL